MYPCSNASVNPEAIETSCTFSSCYDEIIFFLSPNGTLNFNDEKIMRALKISHWLSSDGLRNVTS